MEFVIAWQAVCHDVDSNRPLGHIAMGKWVRFVQRYLPTSIETSTCASWLVLLGAVSKQSGDRWMGRKTAQIAAAHPVPDRVRGSAAPEQILTVERALPQHVAGHNLLLGPITRNAAAQGTLIIWAFPKIRSTLFGGPYNKNPTI